MGGRPLRASDPSSARPHAPASTPMRPSSTRYAGAKAPRRVEQIPECWDRNEPVLGKRDPLVGGKLRGVAAMLPHLDAFQPDPAAGAIPDHFTDAGVDEACCGLASYGGHHSHRPAPHGRAPRGGPDRDHIAIRVKPAADNVRSVLPAIGERCTRALHYGRRSWSSGRPRRSMNFSYLPGRVIGPI